MLEINGLTAAIGDKPILKASTSTCRRAKSTPSWGQRFRQSTLGYVLAGARTTPSPAAP